jgi:hypothetical protein
MVEVCFHDRKCVLTYRSMFMFDGLRNSICKAYAKADMVDVKFDVEIYVLILFVVYFDLMFFAN